MHKTIYPVVLSVLIIAGCGKEFPETSLTSEESVEQKLLVTQDDHDSRVELGRLAFMHNHIDEANKLLTQAVKEDLTDMEAKAWLAANNCKIAGRLGYWLMGLDKLYGVFTCLDGLNSTVEAAPDNFTVLMIQLNTDAEVNMFGSMQRALQTRDNLLRKIEAKPNLYPQSAKLAFFKTAIHIGELQNDPQSIRDYMQRITRLNTEINGYQKTKDGLQNN